jgi:hypothetical protein
MHLPYHATYCARIASSPAPIRPKIRSTLTSPATSNLSLQHLLRYPKGVDDGYPEYKEGILDTVRGLLGRPVEPPYVAHRVPFPDAALLNDGEKYLLHRWLLRKDERYKLVYAYPVWLVVRTARGDAGSWRVVRDNLCPRCGHAVLPNQLAGDGDSSLHRQCRELWGETGGAPRPSL